MSRGLRDAGDLVPGSGEKTKVGGIPPGTRPGAAALLALVLLVATAVPSLGQEGRGEVPPADPADVGSRDAIVGAVYDVISGPAGAERDWDRFRSLFRPDARLIPTGRRPDGEAVLRPLTVEEYIDVAGPQLTESGFFEREVSRVTERFGDIAHVFSTYESRRAADDPEPFQRGINSIQLWNDGERWWIVAILWHPEREDAPIPERYLAPEGGTEGDGG